MRQSRQRGHVGQRLGLVAHEPLCGRQDRCGRGVGCCGCRQAERPGAGQGDLARGLEHGIDGIAAVLAQALREALHGEAAQLGEHARGAADAELVLEPAGGACGGAGDGVLNGAGRVLNAAR